MTRCPLLRITAAGLALSCAIGFGSAQAANIQAFETGDVVSLVGTQFDVTSFTSSINGESATGSGAFIANVTATGSALLVLTEGVGGPFSDWLELIYSGQGSVETIRALWNSDSDPGGLPALPTGVVPVFFPETGISQEVTALLIQSATLSGFSFPSNITIQVQSDVVELAVPLPAALPLFASGLGVMAWMARRRKRGQVANA